MGKGLPLYGLISCAMGGGGSAGLLLSAGVAEAVSSSVLEVFVRQCDAVPSTAILAPCGFESDASLFV